MTYRMGFAIFLCMAAVALAISSPAAQAVNSVTLTDKSGTARTNYPLQLARPFVQGEIANYPQVLINGTAVTTQADVKQRWPDGSVKHAILSLLVPSIAANGSVTLTFQNQTSGNNTPLTKDQMLDSAYNFDAVIQIASGGTNQTASARTMLNGDAYTYWTSGPIATTVILADHSTARAYDMGFDSLRSVRPIFEATFWPTVNKVRVRFIGENCCSEAMEDVGYDLTLKTGNTGQQTVYTKTGYVHKSATRWTKVFWINGAPDEQINIDNNLAYLIQTYFIPRYDTSLTVPEWRIADDYTMWQSKARDIQDAGLWTLYMPQTGGRGDIGHLPRWMTQWLYTGDWRSREIAFTQGDLAGNWALQVREGNASKKYDRAQTISALGRPVSLCARPNLWLFDGRGSSDPDWIIPNRGATIPTPGGAWTPDNAHQPDPFSIQYVLTGEHWYLEQMQMWAAFDAMTITFYQRGPLNSGFGGIDEQIRGDAWVLRSRVNAAFFSPDGTPEKDYFTMITNDALAHWEGNHGVNGAFAGTTLWQWAADHVGLEYFFPAISPLHFFGWKPDGTSLDYPYSTALWMNYMLMMELGITREKGYAADPLASWFSQMLTNQFLDPNYCVYHLADYWFPVKRADGTWLANWTEVEDALAATDEAAFTNFTSNATDTDHGYSVIASAAAAMNADYANAGIAWSFLKGNVRDPNIALFAADPKWAILPRSYVLPPDTTPPAAITSLAASNPTINSITLTWTAPSDPDSLCTAYDIRYSTSTINSSNWASATQVANEPTPAAPGSHQSLTVSGLVGGITYYFAMKTGDAVPNWSAISNVASATTVITSIAMNKPVTASSTYSSDFAAAYAVDGNQSTRWSSLYSDPQWIYVDLGQTCLINRVRLKWNAYGKAYQIQLSDNATDWTTVYTETDGDGGIDDLNFAPSSGRYVRMYGTQRGMGYGYSLYEFEVFAPVGDFTAPAAVSNLAASSPASDSVTLTWTAPGDDGTTGTAASYDIRYSTSAINDNNWASATQVTGGPTPAAAGTDQNVTVSGLSAGTTYYFAMKTADEVPNWSGLSNVVSATTSDVTPPAAVSDLAASNPTASSITLTWTASGDDGSTGTAASYDIRYSTSAINDSNWASAAQVTGEPTPAAAGTNQNMVVGGLNSNTTYYFAMKTSDEVPNVSALSNVVSATTPDVTPPAAVSNMAASNPTSDSVTLSWTAPGDDGSTGTAASYDIRYSTSAINDSNWASATQVTGEPTPAAAGTNQNMVVSGLSSNSTYYFAMKTADEVPNVSSLSNVPSATTAPAGPVGLALTYLGAFKAFSTSMGVYNGGLAFYPSGNGGAGSLFISRGQTGSGPEIWELTIPELVITTNPNDLNIATTLTSFDTGLTANGLTWRSTDDKLYYSTRASGYQAINFRYINRDGSSESATRSGPGWVEGGCGLVQVPDAWATSQAGGKNILTIGCVYGTVFSSADPWNSPVAVTHLLEYSSNPSMTSYDYGDSYNGIAWVEAGGARDFVMSGSNVPGPVATLWCMRISDFENRGSATPQPYQILSVQDRMFTTSHTLYGLTYDPTNHILYAYEGIYGGLTFVHAWQASGSDMTSPAAISDLTTSSPTTSSLSLTWTAPGDDGSTGTAASYDIRYSTSTINDSNWASATQVTGEPTPAAAGTNQSMTVSGLSPGTTYYFAVRTADEIPNWSGLSSVASGTTATNTTNLALNKTATASSLQDSSFAASKAVDGNATTRWASAGGVDPQWISVDLGQSYTISRVKLSWEYAYGKDYTIQVSSDAANWTTAYTVTNGDGGVDDWSFTPVSARYVRMYGTARGTGYGYSIYEFEVY